MPKITLRYLTLMLLVLCGAVPVYAQAERLLGNQVSFSLDFRQGWDDNPLGTHVSSYFLELTPRLLFRQGRPRGFWSVAYEPTLRRYSTFSGLARNDQRLLLDTDFRIAKRWGVDFHSRIFYGNNPFLRVLDDHAGLSTPGTVVLGPNLGFVGPARPFTRSESSLTLRYLLGPHSQLKFGADYFREDQRTELLLDYDTRIFRAEYEKQFARSKSLSALYSLQLFRNSAAETSVRTHSALFTYSHEFRPGTRLTVFAGPQFSLVRAFTVTELDFLLFRLQVGLRLREPKISVAGGGLFSQRISDRTWMELSVSRRVSDGSGFLPTVVQNSARLGLRRQWTKRFSTPLNGYFTDNRALARLGSSRSLRTAGVSTGFDYAFNRHALLNVRYDYSHFDSVAEPARSLLAHNRLSVGLHYSFGTFALGR